MEPIMDQWASWLLQRRHGGDSEEQRRTLDRLAAVRERVLANAGLTFGETLLDVGTGDGLIAFGALPQVGDGGTVIFSDISQDMLDHDRALAEDLGVADRCVFVHAAAEDLALIPDASVDVVTTRSVLAYVTDKERAFAEFARVLRPGGRISLYEPINRHGSPESAHRFHGYDVSAVQDLAVKLIPAYWGEASEVDSMLDFDERDLLAFAERVGFTERHLDLRVDVEPHRSRRWEVFLRTAPNPLALALEDALAEALSPEEVTRFAAHLRPLVERGDGTWSMAVSYLWAIKG